MVAGWLLQARPSQRTFARARQVLRHLADEEALAPAELHTVISRCHALADAAGGLLGIAWRIHPAEEAALRDIAASLGVHRGADAVSLGNPAQRGATPDDSMAFGGKRDC